MTGAEGHGIAAWLNKHGITGVVLEANTHFIQKPFTPGVLADKIRRVLG